MKRRIRVANEDKQVFLSSNRSAASHTCLSSAVISPVSRSIDFGFTCDVRRSTFDPKMRIKCTRMPVYAKKNVFTSNEGINDDIPERWPSEIVS